MVNYNSSEVVQSLRQYDMFANSLRLINNDVERSMVVKQLAKLEIKIIDLTNKTYLDEYNTLKNKKCGLLDEEKDRLMSLIDLINQRVSYVEKRCNSHYQLTGDSIDAPYVEGTDSLNELENRVRIIDKYMKNTKLIGELKDDIKSISNKMSLASEKLDINKSLNVELEATFKEVLTDAFNKLNLFDLQEDRNELEYAFYETEKSLNLAKSNYEVAKIKGIGLVDDCQEMLDEIGKDYEMYGDKIYTLKLMDICNLDVTDYDSLLNKRKEVNEILQHIKNEELLDLIIDTVNKQFNTIVKEEQDVNTLTDLAAEKGRKEEAMAELEDENNSDKFQGVLKELIENERRRQEKILEEQQRLEEIEKQKRLEAERRKQEEILRRQKIIEEARKKEIEKRTKQLLEEQQNSVLQGKKKESSINFEKFRDDVALPSENEPVVEEEKKISLTDKIDMKEDYDNFDEKDKFFLDLSKIDSAIDDDEVKDTVANGTIEKELFDEFNSQNIELEKPVEVVPEVKNNKLPDVSIDEYMKNFKVDSDDDDLFGDTSFPSIPM